MSRVNKMMNVPFNQENSGMSRTVKVSVLIATLMMSGCATHEKDDLTTGSIGNDYRTSHPIIVTQAEKSEDLVVSPTMRKMSFRQRGVVTSVVGQFRRSGAKKLHVVLPSGSHNEHAARAVSADAIRHMKELGLTRNQISVERYHASNHGDAATIRLVYGTTGARVATECGQWDQDLNNTLDNRNYSNFGCATQNNLAQMIANPEDLLGPRGESEIDATRRDNVISDWRDNGTASLPDQL